ncbi:MAG: hypothetical protein KAS39_02515, partial [Actinomycetia bacterium]|nr:hypothetical protein [Actinomycetes bacterium]
KEPTKIISLILSEFLMDDDKEWAENWNYYLGDILEAKKLNLTAVEAALAKLKADKDFSIFEKLKINKLKKKGRN